VSIQSNEIVSTVKLSTVKDLTPELQASLQARIPSIDKKKLTPIPIQAPVPAPVVKK
jgi:hypothetical protein